MLGAGLCPLRQRCQSQRVQRQSASHCDEPLHAVPETGSQPSGLRLKHERRWRLAWAWNTRIYSTLLIDNDCPYRWRGRYNEDTILSLDVLKDVKRNPTHEELNAVNEDGTLKNSKRERYSTVEFITFLQDKLNTQTQKGGNTAEFYQKEGTAAKSAMLVDVHPDVAEAREMYDRDHHKVRYEVFRSNWLVRTEERKAELKKRNWKPLKDKNPYGMRVVERISKDAAE